MSSGASYDGQLCVWDWQGGQLLARVAAQAEIRGASFSDCGTALISVGKEHLKVGCWCGGVVVGWHAR